MLVVAAPGQWFDRWSFPHALQLPTTSMHFFYNQAFDGEGGKAVSAVPQKNVKLG